MGIGGKAWGLREGVELYGGVVVGGWGGEAGVSEGGAEALGGGVVGGGVEPRGGWWLGGWVYVLGWVVWVGGSVWGLGWVVIWIFDPFDSPKDFCVTYFGGYWGPWLPLW